MTYHAKEILIFETLSLFYGRMTKAPGIACNILLFQNHVRIFPATLLQISSSLRSRRGSDFKRGGSREVLVGISKSA